VALALTPFERRGVVLLIIAIVAVRLATLGAYPLMDSTESRYAEIARIMVESGNWMTPQVESGVPFWGKPPLSTWLSAGSMAAFGINEFAARAAPNEGCSEFIELRNDTSEQRSLGGWRIAVSGPGGPPAFYAVIPTGLVLEPGCHLLIATPPSGLLWDAPSMCNLADTGGLALMRPDWTIVDQVGMSIGSAYKEGTPLDPFDPVTGNINQSYERNNGGCAAKDTSWIVTTSGMPGKSGPE